MNELTRKEIRLGISQFLLYMQQEGIWHGYRGTDGKLRPVTIKELKNLTNVFLDKLKEE